MPELRELRRVPAGESPVASSRRAAGSSPESAAASVSTLRERSRALRADRAHLRQLGAGAAAAGRRRLRPARADPRDPGPLRRRLARPRRRHQVFALVAAVVALGATGLIGEVFYTGAVSIALTHPHDGRPPSLREVARKISYGRLIAVDLIYGGAGRGRARSSSSSPASCSTSSSAWRRPVVEIEGHGVRAALRPQRPPRPRPLLARLLRSWSRSRSSATRSPNLATDLAARPARRLAVRRVARRHRLQHRPHPVLRGRGGAAHPRPDRGAGRRGAAATLGPAR